MLKFKREKKGVITQGFNQNLNEMYAKQGQSGHSGIDWVIGHGRNVSVDNAGYVYKTFKPFQLESNWSAVYMLCETKTPGLLMEITYGHLLSQAVKRGETIGEDQVIGKQGNYGNVFSGSRQITVAEQKAGSTRGSHVHENWRPVTLVDKTTRGMHYLRDEDGKRAKYKGKYLQIINKDNGVKGCIDPTANRTKVYLQTVIALMQLQLSLLTNKVK